MVDIFKEKSMKRFITGLILILISVVFGWSSLIIGGIQSLTEFVKVSEHASLFNILIHNPFVQVYLASWVLFFIGTFLSGPIGWKMWKQWLTFIFQQNNKSGAGQNSTSHSSRSER